MSSALVQKLKTMADSVRVAQGLVDMPPNKLTTTEFKDFVVSTATGSPGVSQTVIEGEELQQRGYGGLWNLGKCAETPPCLVVLSLEGTGKSVALVGKSITFDTGGKQVTVMIGFMTTRSTSSMYENSLKGPR